MRATFCPGCGSRRGLLESQPDAPSSAFERICPRCLLAGALGEWPEAREETDPGAVLVGRSLGNYEVLARIGSGSTGTVYRARQRGLDRLVALKVLSVPGGRAPIERFLDEARALARLRNPGVVGIFEVGSDAGRHFYAMDLVDGPSLASRLRSEGPLDPVRAARLLAAVARSVDHAHGLGIVHRDLKPANILLAPGDEPRVADFGLARDALALPPSHEPEGAAVGTAPYMAPEQALGRSHAADARTDVYGLGAVLYECLAGRPPFQAASLGAILEKVRRDPPSKVRATRPEVPAALEAICLRALEKDPSARHQTARALAEALEAWSAAASPSTGPEAAPGAPAAPPHADRSGRAPGRTGRALPAIAIAALVLIAALVAARPWALEEPLALDPRAAEALLRAAESTPAPLLAQGHRHARSAASEPAAASERAPSEHATSERPAAPRARPVAAAEGATRVASIDPSAHPAVPAPAPAPLEVTRTAAGTLVIRPREGAASSVATSPTGGVIAAGFESGRVLLCDGRKGTLWHRVAAPVGAVRALAFFSEGVLLAASGTEGGIARIDALSGAVTPLRSVPDGAIPVLAGATEGTVIVAGRRDGTTQVVDAVEDRVLWSFPGNGRPVSAIAFDARSLRVAIACEGGSDVTVWSTMTGRPVRSIGPVLPPVRALAFETGGDRLAVLSGSGEMRTFRVRDGALLAARAHASSEVAALGLGSEAGIFAASAQPAGTLVRHVRWDRDRAPIASRLLEGPRPGPVALGFATRERVLVAASADRTVTIFDLRLIEGFEPPAGARAPPPSPGGHNR